MWRPPTGLTSLCLSLLIEKTAGSIGPRAGFVSEDKFKRVSKIQKDSRRREGGWGKGVPGPESSPEVGPRRPRAICFRGLLYSCSCGNSHTDAQLLAVIYFS